MITKMKMKIPAELLCSAFIFFLCITTPCSSSSDNCRPSSCDDIAGPEIRFPFRIVGRQPESCGYTGFDLYCNDQGKAILTLPLPSGGFEVTGIDYVSRIVQISDPGDCLSEKILNISTAETPFRAAVDVAFTILRCPEVRDSSALYEGMLVSCRRNMSNLVVAVPSCKAETPPPCTMVAENVSIPISRSRNDTIQPLELTWNELNCQDISSPEYSDPQSKGLPRGVMYGIIMGLGIPSLLCIIGLVHCTCDKIKKFGLNHQIRSTELPTSIATMQLPPMLAGGSGGLDQQTIQSYPKMVLGESWQLPKPNDNNTCPICLSDYEPEETLRSIPNCNHYFHANCIDEWLKLNPTCPLCRKSQENLNIGSGSSSSV